MKPIIVSPAPKRISRRTLLRGASGVALALPFLDAMRPRAARAQAAMTPRRIIFGFQANGDEVATRFTTVGETNFVFGEFLAPLEPYRQDLLILNKLDKKFGKLPSGSVADNHEQGGSSLAPWPSGTGSYPIGGTDTTIGFVLGPSADRSIGDMVLAANPSIPQRHLVYRVGGKRNDIWNLHSHAGPVGTQNPIPPETDPYAAYARIFMFNATDAAAQAAIQKRLLKKQSALDLVLAEANTLSSKVGTKDKQKLDLHMTSLRDIERTLQGMTGTPVPTMGCKPANLGTAIDPYADANHMVIGELFFKNIGAGVRVRSDARHPVQLERQHQQPHLRESGPDRGPPRHQPPERDRGVPEDPGGPQAPVDAEPEALRSAQGDARRRRHAVGQDAGRPLERARPGRHARHQQQPRRLRRQGRQRFPARALHRLREQAIVLGHAHHLPPVHGLHGRHVVRRLEAGFGVGAATRADLT